MPTLAEKLIAKLDKCPCCYWERVRTNGPEDGIPDDCVHESVFRCGAAVFVTRDNGYELSQACPSPLDDELAELQDRLIEEEGDDQ